MKFFYTDWNFNKKKKKKYNCKLCMREINLQSFYFAINTKFILHFYLLIPFKNNLIIKLNIKNKYYIRKQKEKWIQ